MSWNKHAGLALALCIFTTSAAQAAPPIEAPTVMPEAMLSITVSDLHGLIDGVGSVAAQVSPMMNGMMLKNMMGMQLGDPGLAGIAPGKGLAIVALDPTNIFAVIEVGEAQIAAYTNALAPKGVQFEYADGLLVMGQTKEQVAKGVALSGAVKSTLLAKRSPTLRIALQPAAIIKRNNDQIQGLLAMMPMLMGKNMMPPQGATMDPTKILEGELRVFLSLAGQCDVAEVVLALEQGNIRISETYVPKAGTRLATLCNAPVANNPNPRTSSGYLGDGAMKLDATLANPEALMDFMIGEAELLVKEMEIKEVDLPSIVASMNKWWSISEGSFGEVVGFGGDSGFNGGYLMDVKDEAEALAMLKDMPKDLEPMLKLYESMGMTLSYEFKENVRAYKGIKIHQLPIKVSMTNQPPEVTEQLAAMNLTNMVCEVAFSEGVMIYIMGDNKIETTIDRLADETFKPAPLKAHGVYSDGGFYYFDFDVGEYMAFVTSFMPDTGNPMMKQQMATLFEGVEPITSAGYKADGRVMWSVNLPGELIAKYGQMAMMMQMQQMQQPTPAPAPQAIPAP